MIVWEFFTGGKWMCDVSFLSLNVRFSFVFGYSFQYFFYLCDVLMLIISAYHLYYSLLLLLLLISSFSFGIRPCFGLMMTTDDLCKHNWIFWIGINIHSIACIEGDQWSAVWHRHSLLYFMWWLNLDESIVATILWFRWLWEIISQ